MSTPFPTNFLQESRQALPPEHLTWLLDRQTDLSYHTRPALFAEAEGSHPLAFHENNTLWEAYAKEDIFPTCRLTLTHFHVFEWFPLTPGQCFTGEAEYNLQYVTGELQKTPEGYFDPYGKMNMLRGGVGAVRLRPFVFEYENHYPMTASASGTCYEGFPLLVPERFYPELKRRIQRIGAAPATLRGKVRILTKEVPRIFATHPAFPATYLVVDEVDLHPEPRPNIEKFLVSIAISFESAYEGAPRPYVTYATFEAGNRTSFARAKAWLKRFYVEEKYQGRILTDFDQIRSQYPEAVFGLVNLYPGNIQTEALQAYVEQLFPQRQEALNLFLGNISAQNGDVVLGDKHVHPPNIDPQGA